MRYGLYDLLMMPVIYVSKPGFEVWIITLRQAIAVTYQPYLSGYI